MALCLHALAFWTSFYPFIHRYTAATSTVKLNAAAGDPCKVSTRNFLRNGLVHINRTIYEVMESGHTGRGTMHNRLGQ